jgi:RNA polymerase sigma factor (sigma-70 family)
VVCLAGADNSSAKEEALEKLCRAYWMPVYAFIRRRGYSPTDAEDLAQDFFAELLSKNGFQDLDRSRGKFRSFLIACLNHFLAKDWRGRNAIKRGGGREFVPINGVEAEERYGCDLTAESDPAALLDRQWTLAILDRALSALGNEEVTAGKGPLFEALKPFLTLAAAETRYDETARRLQMTPGAVTTAVHRLRHRYRELVREAVAQTVTTAIELEEEMQYLLSVVSR